MEIRKVRPAWSGKKGKGGAIISLPSKIRTEANIKVGDNISMSVVDGKIILNKIVEV